MANKFLNDTGLTTLWTKVDDKFVRKDAFNTALNGKSDVGHTHSYLPLSGGTMTGSGIKFSNMGDADTVASELSTCVDTASNTSLAAKGAQYCAVLNVGGGGIDTYRMQFASYAGGGNTLLYRGYDGSNKKWCDWTTVLHSGNSSVSKSGETLTVKINGVEKSLTNTDTWPSKSDLGLGNVDNTADADKSVKYAISAGEILGGSFSDANTVTFTDKALRWFSGIPSNASNIPTFTGYQNGLLAFPLHGNGVTAQLYISATKHPWFRSNQSEEWNQLAYISDIPTSLPANGGNADTIDGYHASSFGKVDGISLTPDKVLRIDMIAQRGLLINIQATNGDRNALYFVTGYQSGTTVRNNIRVIKNGPYNVYFNGISENGCVYIKNTRWTTGQDNIYIHPFGSGDIAYEIVSSIPSDATLVSSSNNNILATLDSNVASATNVAWSGVTEKPDTFAPSAHSHENINIPSSNKSGEDKPSTYEDGLSIDKIYNGTSTGWPYDYGNALTIKGLGTTQLMMSWNSGQTSTNPNVAQAIYIRSQRDAAGDNWSKWTRLITDDNISTYALTSLPTHTHTSLGNCTLTGTLTIKRSASVLEYQNSGGTRLGYLGFRDVNVPCIYESDGTTYRILSTSEHTHSYLPLSGGTMTGSGIKFSNMGNADTVASELSTCTDTEAGTTLANYGLRYCAVLNVGGGGIDTYRMQFASYAGGSNKLAYRGYNGNSKIWCDWETILHSGNSSVSLSGQTLTVKINGVEKSLTNTDTTYSAATTSAAGLVSTGTQSFAGAKTFTSTVTATGFYESSDERLKDFEDDIDIDLNALKKIPKKYFKFKEDPTTTHIGTSAQVIKELYPEIVTENEEGYLSVDYAKLSVIALSAVDELYDKYSILDNKLNELIKVVQNIQNL